MPMVHSVWNTCTQVGLVVRRLYYSVRPSPEALRGTSLKMPGSDRGPPYLPEHAYKANRKCV